MDESRKRLIETGGRMSQDLGMGRIVGQILIYLYLSPAEASLDEIEEQLELSKASVSIAARQLENFGLLRRVWKRGDRKSYYQTTDNIVLALRKGLVSFVQQKVKVFGAELDQALSSLDETQEGTKLTSGEVDFLRRRIVRAKQLQGRLESVIDNPVVRFLSRDESLT